MALIPTLAFPGQVDTTDVAYPLGKARNEVVEGDGSGVPLTADLLNDIWGFQQALLNEAAITASEVPDEVGASDYLDALKVLIEASHTRSSTDRHILPHHWVWTGAAADYARFPGIGEVAITNPQNFDELHFPISDLLPDNALVTAIRLYALTTLGGAGSSLRLVRQANTSQSTLTTTTYHGANDDYVSVTMPPGGVLCESGVGLYLLLRFTEDYTTVHRIARCLVSYTQNPPP